MRNYRDDERIRQLAADHTLAEIADELGRTVDDIKKRVKYLGVTPCPDSLYMAVTPDWYELPLYVADNPRELGERFRVATNTVSAAISRGQAGVNSGVKYVRVDY